MVMHRSDCAKGQLTQRIQVKVAHQSSFGREHNVLVLDQRHRRSFAGSESWHHRRFADATIVSDRVKIGTCVNTVDRKSNAWRCR